MLEILSLKSSYLLIFLSSYLLLLSSQYSFLFLQALGLNRADRLERSSAIKARELGNQCGVSA
jgi:hypothetical protein